MRYKYFGAFRLFLAILVMTQHFVANAIPLGSIYNQIIPLEVGSLAVLVFFALSGFVISEAVDALYRDKPLAYLTNRFLRIVPHFIAAVMLSAAVFYFFFRADALRFGRDDVFTSSFGAIAFTPRNLLLNLFGFLPGSNRVESFDFLDIAWAVRVEMIFYVLVFVWLYLMRFQVVKSIGVEKLAMAAFIVVVPILVASAFGHLPEKLGLISYFGFGSALYFATTGNRAGKWFVVAFVPLIALQFLSQSPYHNDPYYHRNWLAQAILLAILLSFMVYLATAKFARFRRTDRKLGDLTYPLYLYHEPAMVLVVSSTVGFSYSVGLFAGVFSIGVAMLMTRLVDPMVNRLRDAVRGRRVDDAISVQYVLGKPDTLVQT